MRLLNLAVGLFCVAASVARAESNSLNCFVTDGADLSGTKYVPVAHTGDPYPTLSQLAKPITNPNATILIPVDGGIDLYSQQDFRGQGSTLVNSGSTELKVALKGPSRFID